ncbi:3'-5' exoribonuclease YhaM family protein [Pseudodesulfovibrio piezophilus]|uniref:Metal dependent phosphohydrolase n=1 Tax=Pseudodesulfovibrio piezophilus (strain DSM 21447 / JCM 15486 / C1TLV30) TaxID=1322246 RepID=M1WQJ0_PSEP2|nr:HD domain-containing protein [Pseudodesulfovibrio piezophilus]CCH47727.1 Metal dependent phosphohydrolase [Pseudodesulfovibrio piezophilus C1TLV30]
MTQKSQYIQDLSAGMPVNDLFLLSAASMAQSRNGPYWSLTFQDATGKIDGKIWSPKSQEYPTLEPGQMALVRGFIESYRDKNQLKVDHMELIDVNSTLIDYSDFLPTSSIPPEELMEAIEDLVIEHIQYTPLKSLCRKVLNNEEIRQKMLIAPGAKSVHHAYIGGLLEHTLQVAKACMALCTVYPDLDRQILLVGAIFHDLGKAWELSGGMVNDYTDEGRLLGHIQIGQDKLEPFLKRAKGLDEKIKLHLKHLITSHHGEHDFGSPVRPKTPEAFVLHFADNMDAKLNIIEQAYGEMDKNGLEWSPYMRFLDRNIYKAPSTPDKSKKKHEKPENQCLLPLKV